MYYISIFYTSATYLLHSRIWNQLARFKTSLKILCLHFQRKCEERKQPLNCVRWRIDFTKVEVEELFRAREPRKRKQDLSYARPSARILPRKGRRRIFDLANRWKSTSVGVQPHLGAQSRDISDLLCVLLQSKKRYKYADPQDVRFSDLQCDSWIEPGDSRSSSHSHEISWTRVIVEFHGFISSSSRDFSQSDLWKNLAIRKRLLPVLDVRFDDAYNIRNIFFNIFLNIFSKFNLILYSFYF